MRNCNGRSASIIATSTGDRGLKNGPSLLPKETNHHFFPSDRKQLLFICNLYNPADKESRSGVARILLSLRKHHFLYYKGEGRFEDLDEWMDYIKENDYTLLAAKAFFQYPLNRESATFVGSVKETGEKFLYRIYDKGIFLHLLKRFRSVKREALSKNKP